MTYEEKYYYGFIDIDEYELTRNEEEEIYADENLPDFTEDHYDDFLEWFR